MAQDIVLIVDDNEMNQQMLACLLEGAGFEVRSAGDAGQALQVLKTLRPGLILMDVQLPGMSGLDLTRRIKADPEHRETVIVAVTAYAMKVDEHKAREAGCDGYITKPIDTATFVSKVKSYLAGRARVGVVHLH